MKNPRTTLLVLIPLILLGVIFYVSTRPTEAPSGEEAQQLLPEGSPNERGEMGSNEWEDNGTGREDNARRVEAMEYVSANISRLSPREPVLGGSWFATRFWFVDDANFYVEYEDGHILRKILISDVGESYTVVGYFEPGENDWELIEGSDPYFGHTLDLYEYNERTGKWIKKN